MIDAARLFAAVALFCFGLYLVFDLFVNGFDFLVLAWAIGCFVLAHYVKPRRDSSDKFSVLDCIELAIDIPFRVLSGGLRTVCKPFKDDIDGFDI
ncbi:hypothetical protein [Halopseudomonas salina]|uniref:Uncharacterized protein n=1 Tax=Halopseudomonas salina TaxID=1323744 RepID=A0ABQ1NT54_9GAMM|nr:hypothetical protein [Halopseudomonas salina]GGC84258.1 hypothetical protein GCM10007418_00110 [Halopseudomonas salina]